ncbi:hypothetical protein SAMN05660216_01916 [Pseudomonas sp. LAMO17WK12:I8]|nr:hypothetical protein SAMN05660216_01916 [Pseudomonas sp. LAMO17WK12:I8]SNY18444.1 hypothetical protein SAMN05660893_01778 [Pseudomonas sp. LAMO17WK12:I12]SNY19279.1 hypothetical protein SAMN05660344_01919 [Pseudomonas sp. LAMO17WK12:I11]SNY19308.1 hypothetical protein SAMN05660700_01919 [Pseudomonas sp. LAMO17WK12:I7]
MHEIYIGEALDIALKSIREGIERAAARLLNQEIEKVLLRRYTWLDRTPIKPCLYFGDNILVYENIRASQAID